MKVSKKTSIFTVATGTWHSKSS